MLPRGCRPATRRNQRRYLVFQYSVLALA
uniref:Uncharacterized protein n=1 Tax=Arundo donax TaxID=35708 RepID=A0A0A9CDH2_ARUDO